MHGNAYITRKIQPQHVKTWHVTYKQQNLLHKDIYYSTQQLGSRVVSVLDCTEGPEFKLQP